ncbi:MAG: imidazolonepropionase [Bacteroidetes bacterium]|jgi:imidazolonepropionase|nr:imidazolonepropionase [Bacteroidota bacterium]
MNRKLIINAKGIVQHGRSHVVRGKDMKELPVYENAWLVIEGDKICDIGHMDEPFHTPVNDVIDAEGKYIFPAWCDSHTHVVFAGSREKEFVDRIHGLSYEEIARRGGGILNSAKLLQNTEASELYDSALERLNEVIKTGTGAIEIKSGYGLSFEAELKMLHVIKRLKETSPLIIKATFLGAHALPAEFKENRKEYIDMLVNDLIPIIAEEGLADYNDVFCDRGFFTVEETDRILEAGCKRGLQPKIHANELDFSGGIQVGVKHNALSVDHLECTGDEEIACLLNSNTMPTLLPGTAFFLKIHYPPARKMIDAGLPVALASDYNPGSCPNGKMPFVCSLACLYLGMSPEEAINAATLNSAYAMGVMDLAGSLVKGKKANLFITKKMPSPAYLPYAFGSDLVEKVFLNGEEQ